MVVGGLVWLVGWGGVCVVFAVVGGGVGLVVGWGGGGVVVWYGGGVDVRLRVVELFGVARLGDSDVLDEVVNELCALPVGELVELLGAVVGVASALLDVTAVATGVPAEVFLQRLALDGDLP